MPLQSSVHASDGNIDPRLASARQKLARGVDTGEVDSPSSISPFESHGAIAPKFEPGFPLSPEDDQIISHGYDDDERDLERKRDSFLHTTQPQSPGTRHDNARLSASWLDLPEDRKPDEFSRLKGIQWPGMNCFDAASETMKRQRNQKKDASTFKAMEAASCATEPSELVFSPSGALRREREITGLVDDDDLLPGEWAVSKHRRDRRVIHRHDEPDTPTSHRSRSNQRSVLAVRDANQPVLNGRIEKKIRSGKRKHSAVGKRREYAAGAIMPQKNGRGICPGHVRGSKDEEGIEDLRLSATTTGRRREPRLKIFKDDDASAVEQKRDDPGVHSMTASKTHHEYQEAREHCEEKLASTIYTDVKSPAKLPALTGEETEDESALEHGNCHDRVNVPSNGSRNIDGIYLVDPSHSATNRIPYDPLIGGSVLHYRWDWHGSEFGHCATEAHDPVLGNGLFYNRAESSDTTIYQDEHESKSCLWLDGCGRH